MYMYLRNPAHLTRFRELLEIYCNGAGAKNSWEKTIGLALGDARGVPLPEGWTEGVDIHYIHATFHERV